MEAPKGLEGTEQKTREKLPDNVVIVERPEARYRLIYEKHEGARSPQEIGKPNALAVEYISASGYGRKFAAEALAEAYWEDKRAGAGGSSGEEEYVKKNRIPLYFIDVTDPQRDILDKSRLTSVWLKAGETGLAGGFVASAVIEAIRKVKSGKNLSRREFLGFLGAGAGATFFGTQLLDLFVKLALKKEKSPPGESRPLRQIQRMVGKAGEELHPETEAVLLTLRNAIWAEKLETIAHDLQKEIGVKPEIAFVLGAEHFGLESMLTTPSKERAAAIEKFLERFGLRGARTELADSVRVEYSDEQKKWVATKLIKSKELEKMEKTIWPGNIP